MRDATGPVAQFCSDLSELQRASGTSRAVLASQLGYSKSQLYAILDGHVTRPPDWSRLVEPLVRACTAGDPRAIAQWRRRHDVLVGVHESMQREHRSAGAGRDHPNGTPVPSPTIGGPADPAANRPPAALSRRAPRWRVAARWLVLSCGASLIALDLLVETSGGPTDLLVGLALLLVGLAAPGWTGPVAAVAGSVDQQLEAVLERLAAAVTQQERADLSLDSRLPLSWSAAPAELTDSNLRSAGGRGRSQPIRSGASDGSWEDVVGYVRGRPRLVFLGSSGSGKTVLAHHLTRRWLAVRRPTDAVPIVLGLASWDPRLLGPHEWISSERARTRRTFHAAAVIELGRLLRDLDEESGLVGHLTPGARVVRELLARHKIVPVLDGLDEVPAPLRPLAISRLNQEVPADGRMVLTSRPEEYRQAVTAPGRDALGERTGQVLAGAVVVGLSEPAAVDIDRYLGGGGPEPGQRVLVEKLKRDPGGELARALSTPLMVWLVRTVYAGRARGPDGATMANLVGVSGGVGGAAAVERHLLDQFIPAAYADGRWGAGAVRWLMFLAVHLEDAERQRNGIAWWLLGRAAGRSIGILVGVAIGLLSVVAVVPGMTHLVGTGWGGVWGLGVGTAFGVLCGRSELLPAEMELQVRKRLRASLRGGLVVAVLAGTIIGSAAHSPIVGVLSGLVFGSLLAFAYMHTADVDTQRAVSPLLLLQRDRAAVGTYALVYGLSWILAGSLVYGLWFGLLLGSAAGLLGGVMNGIQYAFTFGTDKIGAVAWARFQVTRIWLATTGRLPWRTMTFLADARERGVLRQEGGVYHFRHARLREQLVQRTRGTD